MILELFQVKFFFWKFGQQFVKSECIKELFERSERFFDFHLKSDLLTTKLRQGSNHPFLTNT